MTPKEHMPFPHAQENTLHIWDGIAEKILPPEHLIDEIRFMGQGHEMGLYNATLQLAQKYHREFQLPQTLGHQVEQAISFTQNCYEAIERSRGFENEKLRESGQPPKSAARRDTGESLAMHPFRMISRFYGFLGAHEVDSIAFDTLDIVSARGPLAKVTMTC